MVDIQVPLDSIVSIDHSLLRSHDSMLLCSTKLPTYLVTDRATW